MTPDTEPRNTLARLMEEGLAAERASRSADARALFERALASLDESNGARCAEIARAIGRTHFAEGDVDAALDCVQLALASAEAWGDEGQVANAHNSLAVLAFNRGDIAEAEPLFERAGAIAQDMGNVELAAMVAQNLGAIAALRGDSEAALERYQSSRRLFQTSGGEGRMGALLCNIGRLETEFGDVEAASSTLEEAVVRCRDAQDVTHEVLARANLAAMHIEAGRLDLAEQHCREAAARAREAGEPRWNGLILKHRGVVAKRRGESDKALELLLTARGLAEEREDVVLQGEVAADLARVYLAQDRNRETLDALFKAHAVFKRVQADRALADIDLRLAEFESVFLAIVQEWGESIDAKDAYTQGHCVRVADYAQALAESLGLEPRTMIWFRMGALLHDVGKVMIPDDILNKPGALDPEEFEIIKQHPAAGESLLSGVGFPWDILPMVRHHHERWDGAGYPDGLSGKDIPLPARILCVADVFDALTTTRSYRAAMDLDKAMRIMESESGGGFDPELYALFRELLDAAVIAVEPASV